MTYNNFVEYVRNKCNYETIYSDGEGRVILVITLLDAYTMTHRFKANSRKPIGDTNGQD